MDFSAPHVDFVIICYVVSAVVLVGLSAIITLNSRKADRQLASLEKARAERRATKA